MVSGAFGWVNEFWPHPLGQFRISANKHQELKRTTTAKSSHAAEFDAQCIAINEHIAEVCELAEGWTEALDDVKDMDAPAAISEHEDALKTLGLTQAKFTAL